ncbi:GTPase-associated protein 1-related protein [Streptomyces sp. GC420]|uniref:GTPase-associated protein 1-related protein n=1 Tax=Streptomyces sp. GC420 TaxID=2697568 RepID=UPI0014152CFC|nr:GTPase-associated protein 1-related protein [Streptomyces sp. GC420]NBM16124.1 hypothetical protein [Streptomyces sp. GC420]
MTLSQLHCTSAPPGPEGSGLRFAALSPGVPRPLLAEVGRLIGYEPPSDAPAHPTERELASFPVAFSHSRLSDGSRLLARTVCTGADGSGHPGGFHAHAVLLPPDAALPGGGLPVTAWDSPQWATAVPDGGVPEPLEALRPSGLLDRAGLVAFAVSRAPWLAAFFADLRALTEDEAAPRILLVERDSADTARWIALACAALPEEMARRLTFTTYTRRPRHAPQQIVGVRPEDRRDLGGQDQRFRVHDCIDRTPARPVTDAWAEAAARVWTSRRPELFDEAAALPRGRPADPGPLAAVALCAGLGLGSGCRTAAADWAREHPQALGEERLHRLLAALSAPAGDRTDAEAAALTGLFNALDGRAPAAAVGPLAALVLTRAVRSPGSGPGLGVLRPDTLTGELGPRLAAELAPELRAGIARTDRGDASRPVELLRIAELLGVDCSDLLPEVARELSRALLADPEAAYTRAVRLALEEQFELRAAVLARLDDLAAGDPPSAARLLGRVPLPFSATQALPHLRMCAEAPRATAGGGDRVTAVNTVLRASGASPITEPLVLRTAVRLVWGDSTPTAGEARMLLAQTGSDPHRAAGTWTAVVRAALEGPADDPDVSDLAHDLLRCFTGDLGPRERGALLLLGFARDLRAGTAGPGWTERALSLRAAAEPVEPTVLEHAFGALASRLLSEDRPDGELYALVHSGDADLIGAYGRAARSDRVRDRLGTVPAYVADCYTAWSSHSRAGEAWQETSAALLDSVLRPVVRVLPDDDTAAVERCLERTSPRRAEEFRIWSRPGAFGRLGRRLTGRGRRGTGAAR